MSGVKELAAKDNSSSEGRVRPNQSQSEREQDAKAAREQMLRVVFSTEARERLSNIKMVKPELAESIENQIFQLAASGRLKRQVTDEELKQMLGSFQKPKKEFKINWK
jgi:programmed cell death protein 5